MNVLRVIVDGLVATADKLPRGSEAGRHLRDAAASLLDADGALEREGVDLPLSDRERAA